MKDPMYLNLSKFASTWRAYLEPVKGASPTLEAFSKVFSPFEKPEVSPLISILASRIKIPAADPNL